jgi:hypothetical protein
MSNIQHSHFNWNFRPMNQIKNESEPTNPPINQFTQSSTSPPAGPSIDEPEEIINDVETFMPTQKTSTVYYGESFEATKKNNNNQQILKTLNFYDDK